MIKVSTCPDHEFYLQTNQLKQNPNKKEIKEAYLDGEEKIRGGEEEGRKERERGDQGTEERDWMKVGDSEFIPNIKYILMYGLLGYIHPNVGDKFHPNSSLFD